MIRIPVIAFQVEALENELSEDDELEDDEELDDKLALFSFFSNSAQGSMEADFSAVGGDMDDEAALLSILLFSMLYSPCFSGVIFTSAMLGVFFPLALPLFGCASKAALGSFFIALDPPYPPGGVTEDAILGDEGDDLEEIFVIFSFLASFFLALILGSSMSSSMNSSPK